MEFQYVTLKTDISVDRIYSIHYFEYTSDFSFPGESHDFWEFLYVDKGEVDVVAGEHHLSLGRGEIIFHKPNEFHSVRANGRTAPNLVVISFECVSPYMGFFCNRVFPIDEIEHHLMSQIIKEATSCFVPPLNDPYKNTLVRREGAPFGSEQLIKLHLENMLINMIRRCSAQKPNRAPVNKSIKQKSDEILFQNILNYLEGHLYMQLTIEKICKDNLVGRSQLQKLFREKTGCGIIDYFSRLKIEAAKQMIRENHLNFTQISDSLGFSSIHYFSRQFKKISGMTPSEYSSSIKYLSQKE